MTVPSEDFEKNLTPENLNTYLSEEERHEYQYLGSYQGIVSPKSEDLPTSKEN